MDVKLAAWSEAVKSFGLLARLDWMQTAADLNNDVLLDGLQNGCIQKFEYTTELCWKTWRAILKELDGLEEASPKKVIKACFLAGYFEAGDFELLLAAVDERNRLSHVYDRDGFVAALALMPQFADLFDRLLAVAGKLAEASG